MQANFACIFIESQSKLIYFNTMAIGGAQRRSPAISEDTPHQKSFAFDVGIGYISMMRWLKSNGFLISCSRIANEPSLYRLPIHRTTYKSQSLNL